MACQRDGKHHGTGDQRKTPPRMPPCQPAHPGEHHPPRDGFQEMLWQLAEAVVRRIAEDVHATGASFWLTATATGAAIAPSQEDRQQNDIPDGHAYTTQRLIGFAASIGIPFVSLREALLQKATTTGNNLEYFEEKNVHGHWNDLGHATVGETLANALCPHVKEKIMLKQAALTRK